MTHFNSRLKKLACAGGVVTAVVLIALPVDALAAGKGADWRPVFDLVLRWVNFLILVAVIVKFSKAPIKSFLEKRSHDISAEIKALAAQKEKILQQIEENHRQLENNRDRMSELKERIVAEGEKNRQRIIEDAETESRLMIESAGQQMNSRILEARRKLKAEILDSATTIAMRKLLVEVTPQDNQNFINSFLNQTAED